MHALQLLLAPTFISCASALPIITPIHATSRPSIAVCLAILVALLLGLLLLVVLKRVYIQQRRVNIAQARQNSLLSLPAGSASAIASVDSLPSHSEKAGFIVGFFGSPTVEIQCALENADWKENKESSFTHQTHTESRRRRLDYPSVLDISRQRNRSVSSSPRAPDRRPVLRSHSFKLPSFPDKARVNSSISPHPRRFSLPTMNRSVAQDSQRRRHSSLKSVRSRRSLASIPGGPALRTVDLSPRLDTPLPLSPRLSIASPASSSISAYSPFSPKFGSRLSRAFIPPLPSTNLPPTTAQRGGPIQISHPYALFPHPRKNVQTSPPVPTEPKFPEQLRQAVATPNTDFIPLDLPALGKPLSPTLSSFPSPPPVTSILKPKLRVRTRRSPAIGPIGPSPLRTMILPESVDSELASYSQIRLNKENMSAKDRQVSVHGSYASLGGTGRASDVGSGLGITRGTSNNLVLKAKRRHSSISSPCPSIVEEDDPGVLLGIIRELVEETSEWDPNSVFMSESFKNLLQESGMTPANSTHGDLAAEATDTQNKSGWAESDSDQSIRSVEADLGFLSLNILKHESFYDVGSSATDDSTRLVSFWDEDSGERSEIVGLAW